MNKKFLKLGKKLKRYRKKTGLTQKQVSKLLGYSSAQNISNLERGVCLIPIKKINGMSEIYKVTSVSLLKDCIYAKEIFLKNKIKL